MNAAPSSALSGLGGVAKRHRSRLLALAILVGSLWILLWLVEEASETELMSFDQPVVDYVNGLDSIGLDVLFGIFTFLGGGWGVLALTALAVASLVWRRQYGPATFVCLSVWGASVVTQILKLTLDRTRPGLADAGDRAFLKSFALELVILIAIVVVAAWPTQWRRRALAFAGAFIVVAGISYGLDALPAAPSMRDSFPSGHATSSAALAASLLVLAWPTRFRWSAAIATTVFLTGVGLSRMYFGVHYPSDILGGWCVSFAWVAVLALTLPRRMIRTRKSLAPQSL